MGDGAREFGILLRYWPGFTDRFPVDSLMTLPDSEVAIAVAAMINTAYGANVDDCQQKLRDAIEAARENIRRRARSVQGTSHSTARKTRIEATIKEDSLWDRAHSLGWRGGLDSLGGDQLCSPRIWLAVTNLPAQAEAAVDELRELRYRYPVNHILRQQWDLLKPRFITVPMDSLSGSEQLRVPASIERLTSGADTTEWARLARQQFLPVVRSLLDEQPRAFQARAASVSFQQFHGVAPPARVHTLAELAEWLGNEWRTFCELRATATPDRPSDVYVRVILARTAIESAVEFLRHLELPDLPQVVAATESPMIINPTTGEYSLVPNHAEIVASAKRDLGTLLDYVRSKAEIKPTVVKGTSNELNARLARLVVALNSLIDSGQSSEGDSPESFAVDDVDPGGDVHNAVVALEECYSSRKLPWEGRRFWLELQRICRHEEDTRSRAHEASNAAQKLAEWAEALCDIQAQRLQTSVVTETPRGNDPIDGDKELGDELRPAAKKAWASWQLVENAHTRTPKDREGYDWLKEQPDEVFVGELASYQENLPSFGTWQRQLRTARNHFDARKNNPRAGRTSGSSVVRVTDI